MIEAQGRCFRSRRELFSCRLAGLRTLLVSAGAGLRRHIFLHLWVLIDWLAVQGVVLLHIAVVIVATSSGSETY
ncbi:hypothetical protein [Aquamicrobium soli]|uniref:Uncharacterized protein n=1 Tax=Aquamicrobium soli TaxID=1811518 RepID=A0ABV7K2I5_9HYPH